MTSYERKVWLAGLKVGDECAVFSDEDYNHPELVTIEAVTSHKIVTSGDFGVFSRHDGTTIYHDELEPVRDSVLECIDREKLWNATCQPLPITTVRKLLAVLAEAGQEQQQGKENQ